MPRQVVLQNSFNAGELDPLVYGRVDVAKYANSCRVLQNFIPTVQGPVQKRGGLRFIGEAKYPNRRCVLVPFKSSAVEHYMLEFGHYYIRFWTARGQIVVGGEPYEVVSPYSGSDLVAADGTALIQTVQSGDVLYIACPTVYPQMLTKLSATNWEIQKFIPMGGPWDEPNTVEGRKISASEQRGVVTLTANFDVFSAKDVGRQVRLEIESYDIYQPWEADRDYKPVDLYAGLRVVNDMKIYSFVSYRSSNEYIRSGTRQPTHTRGSAWDGYGNFIDREGHTQKCGVRWAYDNCGYGLGTITAVSNAREATARVQAKYPLPADINTYRWTLGAWHGGIEYPRSVTFFRERLVWAGGNRIWMSKVGDFNSFEDKDYTEVTAECAITLVVAPDRVQWLSPGPSLFVGTDGGEIIIAESTAADPLGPANVKQEQQTACGSKAIQPVRAGNSTLFVHRSGKQLHELVYDYNSDSFAVPNLCILAKSITKSGVVGMGWDNENSILWCVRKDGVLLGFTYDRGQEVIGWHRHVPAKGVYVESLGVINSPESGSEDLYVSVRTTINGETRRYITYLDVGYSLGESAVADSFFLDLGKTVLSSSGVTTVPTLEHLEGKTVALLVDGGTHPDCVVSNGEITLQRTGKVVNVGLRYLAEMETNDIEAGAALGTAQSAKKRLVTVTPRVLESSGGRLGPNRERTQQMFARRIRDRMDEAPPLFSGNLPLSWPSTNETAGRIVLQHDEPLPFTLLGLVGVVETTDK